MTSGVTTTKNNMDGKNLEMGACYETNTQKWEVGTTSFGDGYFTLRSLGSGKCLTGSGDPYLSGATNDNPMTQLTCRGDSPNQAFEQQDRWYSSSGWVRFNFMKYFSIKLVIA
jgi:hypothetical protein